MAIMTQRDTICSYDVAIVALLDKALELCPTRSAQYHKAARCALDCRVHHAFGHYWDVVGSDGETMYSVSSTDKSYGWCCDCPAHAACYHIYAVRMHVKAQARQTEEPPRYAAECNGAPGIETPLMAGQSHFAPDDGQAFFAPQAIIERGERVN